MSGKRVKVIGEGGAHLHVLVPNGKTAEDGMHKHLFYLNERLFMTDLDGMHAHSVDIVTNVTSLESSHGHQLKIKTTKGVEEFRTALGRTTPHKHEIQSQLTTLSGVHSHVLQLGQNGFISLLPGDLIEAVEEVAKSVPSLREFKIKRNEDSPLETNFEVVQRLNKDDFKTILGSAVMRAVAKSLSRMGDGLRIESLILAKEQFSDIGIARQFVIEHGLTPNSSTENPESFVFQIVARDRFEESTLRRINIVAGVDAVVGFFRDGEISQQSQEAKPEATLPENAVAVPPPAGPVTGSISEFADKNKVAPTTEKVMPDLENIRKRLEDMGAKVEAHNVRKAILRPSWSHGVCKAVDISNTHCKFCGITAEHEAEVLGMGLLCSCCFLCAVEREERGVFAACINGTFDFDAYKQQFPDDPAFLKKSVDVQGMKQLGYFEIAKRNEEQRLITGPVLIPEVVDLQDEVVSAEEIMKAAHNYLIKLCFNSDPDFLASIGLSTRSDRGFMHVEFNRKIALVESFLAPVDFEMNGRKIIKGTWLITVKVFDDEVWNLVKAKMINGFSIAGRSAGRSELVEV